MREPEPLTDKEIRRLIADAARVKGDGALRLIVSRNGNGLKVETVRKV